MTSNGKAKTTADNRTAPGAGGPAPTDDRPGGGSYKFCRGCNRNQPTSEFSVKNKETGLLAARCKECVRTYGRAHHAANKSEINVKIHARRRARSVNGRNEIRAFKAARGCEVCGEKDPDVLCVTGAPAIVSQLVSAGYSKSRLESCLAQSRVLCVRHQHSKAARDLSQDGTDEPQVDLDDTLSAL